MTQPRPSRRDVAAFFGRPTAYLVTGVGYVVYALHQPVCIISWAVHDDTWFANAAESMLRGEWLGSFDQMTLIKGPAFAYFLVVNHLLGTPVTLTMAVFFAVACGYLAWVLRRLGMHEVAAFALFALTLFQPALAQTRVIRDGIYHSLFLVVFAAAVSVALTRRPGVPWLHVVVGGLALGLFWITREEGIWVVPGLLLLVGVGWWLRRKASDRRAWGIGVAVLAAVALVPGLATATANKSEYGAFIVTDFTGGPFHTALKDLDGISAGPEIPHVSVSRAALRAAYQVSPAARELQPYFDGPKNTWRPRTCVTYSYACGEIAAGWMPWALREAAAAAGHYTSLTAANQYWRALSEQIEKACHDGELTCRSNPIPMLPVIDRRTVSDMPGAFFKAARFTVYDAKRPPPTLVSIGTQQDFDRLGGLFGRPLFTKTAKAGFDADESAWVRLRVGLEYAYALVSPLVLACGLVGFCLAVVLGWRRRRVNGPMLVVATVAWVFYLSRLALVALVDVSSFPAINAQYLEPAFVALWIAVFASVTAALPALARPTSDRGTATEPTGGPA